MANGFDPRKFNFREQTAAHNLQAAGAGIATSWEDLWRRGGVKPWQMGWDTDDMDLATRQGASPYGQHQLELEARKRGLRIGPNATKKLNALRASQPEAFKAPINYGALGGYGFDTSDIGAMWGTGFEDKTSQDFTDALQSVRNAWTWAQDQNLPNSPGVDTWIHSKESEQRTAIETAYRTELLEQQRAAAEEQARIQEAAAAQAARVKGSGSTGVGAAATIKGSRLSITEAGGRRGTNRFSRPTPYQYMNTMGISGSQTGKSNLNL